MKIKYTCTVYMIIGDNKIFYVIYRVLVSFEQQRAELKVKEQCCSTIQGLVITVIDERVSLRIQTTASVWWIFQRKRLVFAGIFYRPKLSLALSATILAIGIDEVAAGDGALRTCRILLPKGPYPVSNMKSSTNLPSLSRACARTPDGPLKRKIETKCKFNAQQNLFLVEIWKVTNGVHSQELFLSGVVQELKSHIKA